MKISLRILPLKVLLFLSFTLAFAPAQRSSAFLLPVTGSVSAVTAPATAVLPTLADFIKTVKNGQPQRVVGVYVADVLAFKVIPQPANNPAFVSSKREVVTQFSLAATYSTTALLAHNNLAGALFSKLVTGQEVNIVYGDGTVRAYTVSALRHFQALRPTSVYSNFLDLDNNNQKILNRDIFAQIYTTSDQVVFQTCIAAQGHPSWGRLFVIATPLNK